MGMVCVRCDVCVVGVGVCVLHPVIDSVFSHASISQIYALTVWMHVLCPYMRCCVCLYTHGQMPSNATHTYLPCLLVCR